MSKFSAQAASILFGVLVATLPVLTPSLAVAPGAAEAPVSITEEPLHVVQHQSAHFRLYTNLIEPGQWTLYHTHHYDQMSVIAADVSGASQRPGEEPQVQRAPAGTVLFFPYHDREEPYVHRVGATGSETFVNFGLDFLEPLAAACSDDGPRWRAGEAELRKSTRRGQAYRLQLPAGAAVSLPEEGRGLLLVPLGPATLELDQQVWPAEVGDYRFFEKPRPSRLHNGGSATASVMVVDAC